MCKVMIENARKTTKFQCNKKQMIEVEGSRDTCSDQNMHSP